MLQMKKLISRGFILAEPWELASDVNYKRNS